MINAQADQTAQEALIDKYMMLPNQVWDDIISQASKVRFWLNSFLNYFIFNVKPLSRMSTF